MFLLNMVGYPNLSDSQTRGQIPISLLRYIIFRNLVIGLLTWTWPQACQLNFFYWLCLTSEKFSLRVSRKSIDDNPKQTSEANNPTPRTKWSRVFHESHLKQTLSPSIVTGKKNILMSMWTNRDVHVVLSVACFSGLTFINILLWTNLKEWYQC